MKTDMELKTIKVSQKGQIAIPSDIRKEIGIKEGDELLLFRKGKRIMLEKPDEFMESIKDEFKDMLQITESSLKKFWLNKEDEIWNEYIKRGKK